jgi:hypothetical protein
MITYALVTQLALIALLITALCAVCYARGRMVGRGEGAQAEQAFAYRTRRQATHFDGPRTWWNCHSRD